MKIRNVIANKRFVSVQTDGDGSDFVFSNTSSKTNMEFEYLGYLGRVNKGTLYIDANYHDDELVNELKKYFNFTEVIPTNGSIENERTFENERTVV